MVERSLRVDLDIHGRQVLIALKSASHKRKQHYKVRELNESNTQLLFDDITADVYAAVESMKQFKDEYGPVRSCLPMQN